MATKENQTLQIIIISLVISFLLSLAGLVWVNSNRKAAVARATAAEQRSSEAQSAQRQLQEEANRYKRWMGYAEADSSATIEKSFEEDMQRWGSTFEESSRFYRTILQNIFEENRKLSLSEGEAKEQLKKLKQTLLATEKEKDEQIKEALAELKKVKADAASERNKFETQYSDISTKNQEIASQLDEQRNRFDETVAEHSAEAKELTEQAKKLERVNTVLRTGIPEDDPFAQPADGEVRWVNQRTGTVWINLGEKDGLRPQVTFTIFSSSQDDALTADQKATVEVTRLLGPKMAEARITSDTPTDPIVEGDKIYSQVWSPGRKVAYAITGIVDMDGDGRDDLEKLKTVIRINGGEIDAVPGPNGTMDGEMSITTRFLILGEFPDEPRQQDMRRSWDLMSKEADTFGIEPIALLDFLELIGWKSDNRTVSLGLGAEADDFVSAKEDPAVYRPGKGTDIFRPRKPQPRY